MRVETQEDGSLDVYVRQSWLNDATMCAERGRNGIIRPEWHSPNEMTILGTAVHSGVEHILSSPSASVHDGVDAAAARLTELLSQPFRRVRLSDEELFGYLKGMIHEWDREIRPTVHGPRHIEYGFTFLLDEFDIGTTHVRVWGTGTMDLVADDLWDWKTAGKRYNAKEKQEQAIQPTMYSAAAVSLGLMEYPVTFKYGVMVRGGKAQVVSVVRTEAHESWLRSQIRPFVRQALVTGTDHSWTRNDTHYLCSETWCPWWSVCKGAHLAPSDHHSPKEAQ